MRSKFFFSLALLPVAAILYRLTCPNDFFISDRLFKENPIYSVEKNFRSYKIIDKSRSSHDLEGLLTDLDFFFDRWPDTIFKDNKKRSAMIAKVGNTRFFIKRYKYKNLLDYITKCSFRSSKAFRSFYYAKEFENAGLKTPRPIALYEKRIGFLWTNTYLVFECVEYETIENVFKQSTKKQQEQLLKKLYTSLAVFYKNKWVHRDLCLRNLMLEEGELVFLDLDDMHAYAFNNLFFKRKFKQKHTQKMAKDLKITSDELCKEFLNF